MTLRRKAQLRLWDARMLNGYSGNINRPTKRFIMRAIAAGLHVTSTTGGRHAPGSYHYPRYVAGRASLGMAADVAGPMDLMQAFQRREHSRRGRRYLELFGPVNAACRKNGQPIVLGEGTGLERLHDNHVHGACKW